VFGKEAVSEGISHIIDALNGISKFFWNWFDVVQQPHFVEWIKIVQSVVYERLEPFRFPKPSKMHQLAGFFEINSTHGIRHLLIDERVGVNNISSYNLSQYQTKNYGSPLWIMLLNV